MQNEMNKEVSSTQSYHIATRNNETSIAESPPARTSARSWRCMIESFSL
ncbi:hypothetical protein Rcae01_00691 [Novipirellula caenicola]|uniref:Uncharacterized protein n=1 Tax=Novipirellula caenicola TaxID=1536901 RepID=A0ABP9VJ62_9BACT